MIQLYEGAGRCELRHNYLLNPVFKKAIRGDKIQPLFYDAVAIRKASSREAKAACFEKTAV